MMKTELEKKTHATRLVAAKHAVFAYKEETGRGGVRVETGAGLWKGMILDLVECAFLAKNLRADEILPGYRELRDYVMNAAEMVGGEENDWSWERHNETVRAAREVIAAVDNDFDFEGEEGEREEE